MKVHWTLPEYLQRSARHLASKTDLEQAMAVGKAAVQYALAGRNATMPVIVRNSDAPYRWKIEAAPLAKIAHRETKMPAGLHRRDEIGSASGRERQWQYVETSMVAEAYQ